MFLAPTRSHFSIWLSMVPAEILSWVLTNRSFASPAIRSLYSRRKFSYIALLENIVSSSHYLWSIMSLCSCKFCAFSSSRPAFCMPRSRLIVLLLSVSTEILSCRRLISAVFSLIVASRLKTLVSRKSFVSSSFVIDTLFSANYSLKAACTTFISAISEIILNARASLILIEAFMALYKLRLFLSSSVFTIT